MKVNELVKIAEEYLKGKNRKRKAKINYLKKVLKKLSKREKKLEIKFAEETVDKEKISHEIALIHAHREKGLSLLKDLKNERKEAKLAKRNKKLRE
jgi:hypothetical protein